MLRYLAIRNLAIIDRLEVEFEPGLTVLTGETGAGKSIVVEAIDLLMGGRASAELVRTGESLASVQAIFDGPGGERIVRREVSAQGRSRAFIDDTLATTAALREMGASLVDLHGQHEHQALLDPAEHAGVVDTFGEHTEAAGEVAETFAAWRAAVSALDRTQLGDREKRARIEMAAFQLQEIDRVAPKPGEDDSLEGERRVLANADRLSRLSTEAYAALYDGEHAALPALATVWKRLSDLAAFDPRAASYVEQKDEVRLRLEDLAFFLRSYASSIEAAPDRLQAVEDRLAAIERLKKKHGPTLADVLERRSALAEELAALEASGERAAALESQAHAAAEAFLGRARALSADRTATARRLSRELASALGELAMPGARVEIRVEPSAGDRERWSRTGIDEIEILLSPNPGEDLRPLARIASGGELSRVMLALRTLAARDEGGRTLVFDEVDAGIGGAAADAVGARLQVLGQRYQVLCVTHLAQIAARAGSHLHIAKSVRAGRTSTSLTLLDRSGREAELARMIAGAQVSAPVLASARELLATRSAGEQITKAKERRAPRGESESRSRSAARGRRG